MKLPAVIAITFTLLGAAKAQVVSTSSSGQFVVYPEKAAPLGSRPFDPAGQPDFITLKPALLVISCERIKQALRSRLDAGGLWRGKIFVSLHPAGSPNDLVTIGAEKFGDHWIYRVDLPDALPRSRFVTAIVQVVLLELANRDAGRHSAEIPVWLAEGLAQELIMSDGLEILLPPPQDAVNGLLVGIKNVSARRQNPLTHAQEVLRTRPPLTFDQLSWPAQGQLAGEAGVVYRSSAQLFVDRLLHLRNGPACLRAMLANLPRYYNWQFAFLNGFQSHFQRLLDVEKWWALQLVQFAGRDLTQTWRPKESWQKLDEILRSQTEVRARPDQLPRQRTVTLQTMIRELDIVQQRTILQGKLRELNSLRVRVSQDFVALVDDYRQVIGTYLQRRSISGPDFLSGKQHGFGADWAAAECIQQLNALDARRAALKPGATPAPVASAAKPSVVATR